MKKFLAATALATSLLFPLSHAFADTNWNGIGITVAVGAGSAVDDIKVGPGPQGLGGPFSFDFNGIGGKGAFASMGLSADRLINQRVLVGAFFDYDFSDIRSTLDLTVPGLVNVNGNAKLTDQWTLGARAGVLLNPDTLAYGLIGYSQATMSDPTLTASVFGTSTSLVATVPTFKGWTFGGGMEAAIKPNLFLKAEYRYTEYGSENLTLPGTLVPGINQFVTVKVEPTVQTARVGLTYKFNWDHGDDERAPPMK